MQRVQIIIQAQNKGHQLAKIKTRRFAKRTRTKEKRFLAVLIGVFFSRKTEISDGRWCGPGPAGRESGRRVRASNTRRYCDYRPPSSRCFPTRARRCTRRARGERCESGRARLSRAPADPARPSVDLRPPLCELRPSAATITITIILHDTQSRQKLLSSHDTITVESIVENTTTPHGHAAGSRLYRFEYPPLTSVTSRVYFFFLRKLAPNANDTRGKCDFHEFYIKN